MTKKDGLGLDNIGGLSELLDDNSETPTGKPLWLDISLIDEDPNQPRVEDNPGFSKESIAELAASIKERGVKSPISVRKIDNGRFMINHGARRLRASIAAGKTDIPAHIDDDYTELDQVVENLQRNKLTAREIADVIGRELAKGRKKGEIAKSLGKSNAFVTQHLTLLELPDIISDAVAAGRTNDVTVINELVTAYKDNSDEVVQWLEDDTQEVTRGAVKLLREFIADKDDNSEEVSSDYVEDETEIESEEAAETEQKPAQDKKPQEKDPDKLSKAIVLVIHDERPARLMLNKRPEAEGYAWLKYEDDGEEFSTDLGDVRLLSIIDGS